MKQFGGADFAKVSEHWAWGLAREKFAEALLVALALLLIPGLASSLSRISDFGWLPVMGLHIFLFVVTCCAALFRKRLPYHLKAGWVLCFMSLVTLGALFNFALYGGGVTFMVGTVCFTLMLYGLRASIAVLLVVTAIAALFSWMHLVGILTPPVDPARYVNSYSAVVIILTAFVFVCSSVIFGAGYMIRWVNKLSNTAEQSTSRLGLLAGWVNEMQDPFAVFDAEDRLQFFNKAFMKLHEKSAKKPNRGMSFEELIKAFVESGLIVDAQADSDAWIKSRLESHRNPTGPVEQLLADKRVLLIQEQKLPDGMIVMVFSDITELNQARQQVFHAGKLSSLGEMSAGVAHELNQPLNSIMLAAHNLRNRSEKQVVDPGYLGKKLDLIQSQVERGAKIINQMRRFGRTPQDIVEPFKPLDAIQASLSMVREELRLANITLIESYEVESCEVLGEQLQLELAVLNLVHNARDSIQETGAENGTIAVSLSSSDNVVEITVTDSGGGIPATVLPKLFQPFFTTKPVGKGTGLGLSISHEIISRMGGSLSANNISEGARFTVTLPQRPRLNSIE